MKACHFLFSLLLVIALQPAIAQQPYTAVDPKPFADNYNHWYGIFDKSNVINPLPGHPRYEPSEIIPIADNILLFQRANGGWEKNYDVFAILSEAQKDSLRATKNSAHTTYDNGSTFTHVAALANIYTATKEEKYKAGALKGFDFIVQSQYPNGGWPQYYPLQDDYSRCVTYNDGNFEGIIELLKEVKDNKPAYEFLNDSYRKKIIAAYDKAIPCILKTQINDAGKPTAWCQQYNEVTLQPAWARKFEPPSICNSESADVVAFLMRLDHPSKEIIDAVQYAVAWFQASGIRNTRVKTIPAERMVTPFRVSTTDKLVVTDSAAPVIWARFYELKTHRPIFCDRDSKIVYSLAEVGRERRDGYGWYTYSPQSVLKGYPAWQQKWAPNQNVLK